MHASVMKI